MKKRYIIASILILISLPSAFSGLSGLVGLGVQIVTYSWFLFVINSVEKIGKDGPFTTNQKLQVIITIILGYLLW